MIKVSLNNEGTIFTNKVVETLFTQLEAARLTNSNDIINHILSLLVDLAKHEHFRNLRLLEVDNPVSTGNVAMNSAPKAGNKVIGVIHDYNKSTDGKEVSLSINDVRRMQGLPTITYGDEKIHPTYLQDNQVQSGEQLSFNFADDGKPITKKEAAFLLEELVRKDGKCCRKV